MLDFFLLMWKPLAACLILTGIHAYLGLHVIERKVIFVDLALAQIAALGATFGILFNIPVESPLSYWFSLGCTFLGALIFAFTRSRREKIPHEAVIGIVYAVAAAGAILILSRSPEGDEHIRSMLVGNILLVSMPEILKMLILYSLIGFLHWIFRKEFLLISTEPEEAFRQNLSVRKWDAIFYCSFGFVVTSSVALAGVLLVFSYLIVPAVAAVLVAQNLRQRIILGWLFGALASLVGITASYVWDFPTGATIVCTFGLLLLIVAGIKKLI